MCNIKQINSNYIFFQFFAFCFPRLIYQRCFWCSIIHTDFRVLSYPMLLGIFTKKELLWRAGGGKKDKKIHLYLPKKETSICCVEMLQPQKGWVQPKVSIMWTVPWKCWHNTYMLAPQSPASSTKRHLNATQKNKTGRARLFTLREETLTISKQEHLRYHLEMCKQVLKHLNWCKQVLKHLKLVQTGIKASKTGTNWY